MYYNYKCPNCGHEQEEKHGMNENPVIPCAKCFTTSEKQITGGAGVHFKGPGFHCNDYPKGR